MGGRNLPRRKQTQTKDITLATAQHIVKAVDGTDWRALLEQHRYCATCPARGGPVEVVGEVCNLCAACPLRPLMMALADMALRQGKSAGEKVATNEKTND